VVFILEHMKQVITAERSQMEQDMKKRRELEKRDCITRIMKEDRRECARDKGNQEKEESKNETRKKPEEERIRGPNEENIRKEDKSRGQKEEAKRKRPKGSVRNKRTDGSVEEERVSTKITGG